MKKRLSLCMLLLFLVVSGFAQPLCRKIQLHTSYNDLTITLNNNRRVTAIAGTEDGEPTLQLVNILYDGNGFPQYNPSMKAMKITPYADGYMIRNKEDDRETIFFINQHQQIYQWQVNSWDDDNPEHFWVFYTYDKSGNCQSITCKAETKSSTSEIELKPVYDLSKNSVFQGDVMAMLPEMLWTVFPFTNKNLLTGFEYTQSISVPDKFIALARDRKFKYQFDAKGRVTGIDATGVRFSQHITIAYSDCQ